MATEWATACAHWPASGHKAHLRERNSEAKARQAVIDANHHAEMHPGSWYAKEAPHRVLAREVTPWTDSPGIDPVLEPSLFDMEDAL